MNAAGDRQAGISRRGFLAVAAAGGALAAGGLWLGQRIGAVRYPDSPWPHLDARAQAVFVALGRLWLPADREAFPAPESLPVLRHIDHGLGHLDASLRGQVLSGMAAFEQAAVIYGWHGSVFSQLEADEARAYVRRWAGGLAPQRALVGGLRLLVVPAYWREPATWAATGYQGPLYRRAEIPALGDAPEPTRA